MSVLSAAATGVTRDDATTTTTCIANETHNAMVEERWIPMGKTEARARTILADPGSARRLTRRPCLVDMTHPSVKHVAMLPSSTFPPLCFAAPGGGFGPPPGGYGPPPGGGFGPPGGYAPPPIRQVHTMAIVSLIASIVGWFFCPLIGGVIGLVTGMMARNAIKAEPNRWDGDGMAIAGMIVGGINAGMWILMIAFYVLMLVGVFGAAALGA